MIRKLEKAVEEAYIRQEYDHGDISEFDWGTVKLDIQKQLDEMGIRDYCVYIQHMEWILKSEST